MEITKEKVLTFVPLNKGEEEPNWISNLFDEVIYSNIYRAFADKEKLNEIYPVASITTQDEGGNERTIMFNNDQLTALIKHLENVRWDMMQHFAEITSFEFEKKRAREAFENYEKKCKENNDSRRKGKG